MNNSNAKLDAGWFENVRAVLKQSRSQVETAADKIMSGVQKRPDRKKPFKYGLTFLNRVYVKMFGPLDAETVGLHFEGSRMFWLLLSKDLYSEADLQAWYDNATNLASRAIKPNPIESQLGISAELHCDVPPLMCDLAAIPIPVQLKQLDRCAKGGAWLASRRQPHSGLRIAFRNSAPRVGIRTVLLPLTTSGGNLRPAS